MSNIIDSFLRFMIKNKASDLHLSSGESPVLRIDGDISRFGIDDNGDLSFSDDGDLDNDYLKRMLIEVMGETFFKTFEKDSEADLSYSLKGVGRFRVNVFKHNRGIGTILRAIPEKVLTMAELGLEDDPVFKKLANTPKGLVLVTGPTGSGKSTTLAAMIDYINKNKKYHILTIEDPVEFVHEGKKSVINQREVHRDTNSFNNALRAALREDPDVILVGELRDLETIKLALTAAETGHVVFGTLHTNSATKTIDRIIDVFPGSEQGMVRSMLSESLVGVVSQNLMKKKNGGRVAVHEVMIGTNAIKNLIREDKVAQMYSMLQTGSKDGMKTMDQALTALVLDDLIDINDAREKAITKKNFT